MPDNPTPSPLTIFMTELQQKNKGVSVTIEIDNAKTGIPLETPPQSRFISRHSSMPMMGRTRASLRCRWEAPVPKQNARWSYESIDSMDSDRSIPGPPNETINSPICPRRRESAEKVDIDMGTLSRLEHYKRPSGLPSRRSSYQDLSLKLPSKPAPSPMVRRDLLSELPDYKSALLAVQRKYASGQSVQSSEVSLPTCPIRRESLDEFHVLGSVRQMVQ